MRIWMVNQYIGTPDTPGSSRHFDFAREFTRGGHQVCVFASAFGHHSKRTQHAAGWLRPSNETLEGAEFVWLKTFPYKTNDWRRSVNMISYALQVFFPALRRPRPDVVLGSSPQPLAAFAGWALAKMRRSAFVLEVMDLWPETLVEIGGYRRDSLSVRILALLERFLYRHAYKIVVLHPQAADYIARLGIERNKIVWIPIGANPDMLSSASEDLPNRLAAALALYKAEGKVLVGYAGAHGIVNALDTLLDAARYLWEKSESWLHFVLVGDGPEKRRLIAMADGLRLPNVAFFESIPKSAIPRLLSAIDIGVITWRRSGLYRYGVSTNKLWDYMMCGKPVVWGIEVGYDPVALSGCGITVPPEDAEALGEAVLAVGKMIREERQEMGRKGRDYVLAHHSTPVLAERLREVLVEASGHRSEGQTRAV